MSQNAGADPRPTAEPMRITAVDVFQMEWGSSIAASPA